MQDAGVHDWGDVRRSDLRGGGVRWVLPRRRLGWLHGVGWLLVAIGLAPFVMLAVVLVQVLVTRQMGGPSFSPGWIFGAIVLLPGVVLGPKLVRLGMVIALARAEVDFRPGAGGAEVIAREIAGPVRWTRRREASRLSAIVVSVDGGSDRPPRDGRHRVRIGPDSVHGLGGLLATQHGKGGRWPIAVAYPPELIRTLGDELRERLDASGETGEPVALHEESARLLDDDGLRDDMGADPEPVPDPPEDTSIVVTRREGELSFEIPADGYFKGSSGLGAFGLLWNGFMVVFTTGAVVGLINNSWTNSATGAPATGMEKLLIVGMLVLFWGVGIGLSSAAYVMGNRRSTIDVVGDALLITRHSPIRSAIHEFTADRIESIKAGASGVEVNEKPVLELQIRLHEPIPGRKKRGEAARKLGMLMQRSDEEVRWIAAEVNAALAAHRRTRPTDGPDHRPADDPDLMLAPESKIRFEPTPGGVRIAVPKGGFFGGSNGLGPMASIVMLVVVAAGAGMHTYGQGVPWVILSLVTLICVAMGCIAVVLGGRRCTIDVRGGRLTVERRSPMRSMTHVFEPGEIESIRAGESGTVVNGNPVLQLVIDRAEGSAGGHVRMLGQRRNDEVRRVAAELRRALGMAR